MSDVFISYSRKDKDFISRLYAALLEEGREVWVDWEDIPRGVNFLSEIYTGIDEADTFIIVVSRQSLTSEICNYEIRHAINNNKRIIPLIRQRVEGDTELLVAGTWFLNKQWGEQGGKNWEHLKSLNWLFFDDDENFDSEFTILLKCIDEDQPHIKMHTTLGIRVKKWEDERRDKSFLLTGAEIAEAEVWLNAADTQNKQPSPTSSHREFIIESRAADDEQKELAEKNKAILESITDGVILVDPAGLIMVFNKAAERILGILREQVINKTLNELNGSEEATTSMWSSTLSTYLGQIGGGTPGEHRLTIADSIISIRLSPVHIGAQFLGMVSVLRDITYEVEEDRRKRAFVANVSHEFRTPLVSAKGYSDLLLMGAFGQINDGQKQALETIRDNVARLSSLVEDMIAISQSDPDSRSLTLGTVDINQIIEETLQHIRTLSAEQKKDLTINFESKPNITPIQADTNKVYWALYSLIGNAFSYTRYGGAVDVDVHSEEDEACILISIQIRLEHMEEVWIRRLFEFNEAGTTTIELDKTDLGLAMAAEIVEMHNGKVWSTATDGVGVVTFARLPVKSF